MNIKLSIYTMDYFGQLPLEILDEVACDELTYRGLLALPMFARSLSIGRRFDFMVKFGHDFHAKQHSDSWCSHFTRNGVFHRLDGPAKIYSNVSFYWMKDGKNHRIDGPATIYIDGNKYWYANGMFHRIGGPALEWVFGPHWYICGIEYSEEDYNLFTANM